MNCPLCFQTVAGGHAFCPHCGARLAEAGAQTVLEAAQDPTYGALAYANLLRLRGDWDQARDKTVTVMREFPNNGTAHSLMGDIFADQQIYEDAAQWYRMALDLEPNNVADARKLAAMEAHLRPKEEASPAVTEAPVRFSIVRVAAAASLIFLLFAISLGFYVKTHTVPLTDLGPIWTRQPERGNTTPKLPQATDSTPDTSTEPPAAGSSDLPGLLTGAAPSVHSLRETSLASALNAEALAASGGAEFVDAMIDPSTQTAVVTLSGDKIDSSSPAWTQTVDTSALGVALRALKADTALRTVSVRVVMRMEDGHATNEDVAFVGSLDRPTPAPLLRAAPASDFTRRWWRPGLSVPAATGNTERGPLQGP